MEALIKRLQEEVQSELEVVNSIVSPVKGYDKKMKVVKLFIMQLKHHVAVHSFPDKATEIKYFKYWLPSFYKQYIYFTYLYQLERTRITADVEPFSTYLENERKRIANFLNEHQELFFYHLLEETDKDELLFIRTPLPDANDFIKRGDNFCEACIILAELLAYDEYKKVLEEEIVRLTQHRAPTEGSGLKWIGTKRDAVELIALLYEAKLFDYEGRVATLEQLKRWAKESMQVDLKDFKVIDNSNRTRKKSSTALLDKFIRAASSRENRLNP